MVAGRCLQAVLGPVRGLGRGALQAARHGQLPCTPTTTQTATPTGPASLGLRGLATSARATGAEEGTPSKGEPGKGPQNVYRQPTILALHGITMCGDSMMREAEPLIRPLAKAGYFVKPVDAPHVMSEREVRGTVRFCGKSGLDTDALFHSQRFWGAEQRDWFRATGDRFKALAHSLQALEEAASNPRQEVVGLIGFSQGAAMASLVAALATAGRLPAIPHLRFAVLVAGFVPKINPEDDPCLGLGTVSGINAFVVQGEDDVLFPPSFGRKLADRFDPERTTFAVAPGLGHEMPTDPELLERVLRDINHAMQETVSPE